MDQLRGDNGQFISLEKFVMSLMDERFSGLRNEIAKDLKALELQAREYERRLTDLNHAHARAQEVQNTFVRLDKWEDNAKAEEHARKLALDRLDEKIAALSRQANEAIANLDKTVNGKLDDYITKVEARQAEMDQAIALGKGAAQEAQRAAEEQGRKSDEQARELARKTNRNMAILGVVVAIVIAFSQWIGITAEPPPPPDPVPVVTTIPAT